MSDDFTRRLEEIILRYEKTPTGKATYTTIGLIPFLYNISKEEIDATISMYKKNNPQDRRSYQDLLPYAVNSILLRRRRAELGV